MRSNEVATHLIPVRGLKLTDQTISNWETGLVATHLIPVRGLKHPTDVGDGQP